MVLIQLYILLEKQEEFMFLEYNERVSIKLFRQSTTDLTQIVQEFTQEKK